MPSTPSLCLRNSFLSLMSLVAAGCGAEVYETRLKSQSVPFFGYQRELDTGLGARWKKGDVSVRLPGEFKEIPAPKTNKAGTPSGRDPRLPPGFEIELEGILGGFKGSMRAEPAGGKAQEVPVFALVLSNRSLLASKEPTAKPAEFDKRLSSTLSAGLQKGPSGLRQYVYTDSIESDQRPFAPSHRIEQSSIETTISGVPMRYEVYVRREAPLIAAVVFVVPKDPARDEQLKKRIDLSLQTLRVEAAASGIITGGSAPQPGGAGPTF